MTMMNTAPAKRDLVLLGGGHAHVLALRRIAMRRPADLRITLVSEADYAPYSGMLPGLIAGHYSFDDVHIDLRRYCSRLGVRFVRAPGIGVDLGSQLLLLEDHCPISYDLLSMNIGARPDTVGVAGAAEYAIPVKPVAGFYRRWQRLEQSIVRDSARPSTIRVVGGGAGSVEMALAIAFRLRDFDIGIHLHCGQTLLDGYGRSAIARVRRALSSYGIGLIENDRVQAVRPQQLVLESGHEFDFDILLWCTGAVAADFTGRSDFACDDKGFLLTQDDLRVVGQENVFAVGDMAVQVNHPRPRAGVYAVRQSPVLAENLLALHKGLPLKSHRPQSRFLSLLSLGGRKAVADRGWLQLSGDWVWRWKDSIDRGFMQRFENLPQMKADGVQPADEVMHCGGCGAKLPATLLRHTLRSLAEQYPSIVDPADFNEDAAVLEVPAGKKLVQTTDSLRALVDDPWVMGRIAALHALSDLYAMGAAPHSCLAHITIPYSSEQLQQRDLLALMSGAMLEMNRCGAQLVGGHSLEGEELSVGFTVNGLADGDQILRKDKLRHGDRLVLTKGLGTGALFVAQAAGDASGDSLSAAIDSMLLSNSTAADIAHSQGVLACTDVTGFGLLGHLLEMLGSNDRLQVRIALNTVPLLDGAREALVKGHTSTLYPGNRAAAAPHVQLDADCATDSSLALYDPQTSGGLLLAVDQDCLAALLSQLHAAGYAQASCIGVVEERFGDNSVLVSESLPGL